MSSSESGSGECRVGLAGGGAIVCDAYPHDVSFIRVEDSEGVEVGYWVIDEIAEDPVDVIGAILGAARSVVSRTEGEQGGDS